MRERPASEVGRRLVLRGLAVALAAASVRVRAQERRYRIAFAGRYKAAYILDTPGPTPAVMHHVAYRNLRRPYYPADRDIPGLKPRTCCHGG